MGAMDNGTESHGNEWDDWRQVNHDCLFHLISSYFIGWFVFMPFYVQEFASETLLILRHVMPCLPEKYLLSLEFVHL